MSGQSVAVPARHGGDAFIRTVHAISTACGWIAAGLLVASLLVTCQMIISRALLGNSTIWQTETVIYFVIAAICIGLSYVQLMRGHVNVDLLPLMMSPSARRLWAIVLMLATIGVIALMSWYSFDVLHQAWRRNWKSPSVWAPPMWPVWAAITAGFGLLLLQLIADFYALLRRIDPPFSLEEK